MIRLLFLLAALVAAQDSPSPSPSATPTATPPPSPSPSATPPPSPSPSLTPSPSATPAPSPSASPTPTQEPTGSISTTIQDQDGYIVADVKGASGTYDQNTLQGVIKDGEVVYYFYPKARAAERKVLRLNITFPLGRIDGKNFRFNLEEGATVTMEDGTRLDASDLLLDRNPKPGQPHLVCTRPIKLTKPGIVLTGPALEADDSLNSLIIPHDGYLEIQGRPQDLGPGKPPVPPGTGPTTILRSKGPLHLRQVEGGSFFFISGDNGITLNRSEQQGHSAQISAESLVLYLSEQEKTLVPVSATARGAITLLDSGGAKATASAFDWDASDDVVRMANIDLVSDKQKIKAQVATFDRVAGIATFTGQPLAEVPMEAGQPPLKVSARTLALEMSVAGTTAATPSKISARGDVRITGRFGTMDKAQPIDATGLEFTWDAFAGSGRLVGRPYARILQGESIIEAPLIVFEGRSMIVVKGPKAVQFVHVEPPPLALRARNAVFGLDANLGGKRTKIAVSTLADITFDSDSRLITVLDRCEVRTDDFLLGADRLSLRLNENGKDIDMAHALGRVRLERPSEGVKLMGDAVAYRPISGEIEVSGSPRAFGNQKDIELSAPVLRYDEKRRKLSMLSQ